MTYKISDAISSLNPNARFKYNQENIDTIEWLDDTTPIAKETIQAKLDELEAEYTAQQYARSREDEYPPIGEQLDMIFKSGILNDTDWAIKIQSIKDKYPKPKE